MSEDTRETYELEPQPPEDGAAAPRRVGFPVVGIGASAGGLEALKAFFKAVPADTGMAFALVLHLDPTHESHMAELLSRYTAMPVSQVERRTPLSPNRIYVIPPNRNLALRDGALTLSATGPRPGIAMPIDFFLRSLAKEQQERAIAIILTGTGSDGSLGIREIKAEGGLVMVQDPRTAEHEGMPSSAIATGMVDRVAPVEKMPELLIEYVHHALLEPRRLTLVEATDSELHRLLTLLYTRGSHDFRAYKKNTLIRRIQRRMGLNRIRTIDGYLRYLREHQEEVDVLAKDLLIGVTSFFREPEAWKLLDESVLPELFRSKRNDEPIRAWVAGCATGEEAYSLAMLLVEHAESAPYQGKIQIFATDVDKAALEVARAGVYPQNIAANVSPERLRRFFSNEGDVYRVRKELRESVVFAPQNLLTDSPFSRLDLVSCRNLLIYLEPGLQERIIALFHFALNRGGLLVLGTSETVGQRQDLFLPLSKKWRIYRRVDQARPPAIEFPLATPAMRGGSYAVARRQGKNTPSLADFTKRLLLERYAPATVVIDRDYQVLYYFGPTEDYIAQPSGDPTSDLLAMTGEGLRTKLRAAVHRAVTTNEPVAVGGGQVKRREKLYDVEVTAVPLCDPDTNAGLLLVSFRDLPGIHAAETPATQGASETGVIQQLEEELRRTREDLHSTIEELEASNEELKVSNEEAMSLNEELQSANEELETSKEELQSLNEELSTINSQLENKVAELESTSNDLQNLLTSTNIATVFLDRDFRIRRFTQAATKLLRLIPTDMGRSITDIAMDCDDPQLLDDAARVLDDLVPTQKEVRTAQGELYLRRVLPYRTQDNRIKGVVVTYIDLTERRQREEEQIRLAAIVEASHDAIIGVDLDGRIIAWNPGAATVYGYQTEEAIGQPVSMLMPPAARDGLQDLLRRIADGETVDQPEATFLRADGTQGAVWVSWWPIRGATGTVTAIGVMARDITERRLAEQALRASEQRLREQAEQLAEADRRKNEFLAMLGHELRNPLASMKNAVEALQAAEGPPEAQRLSQALDIIARQVGRLTHLVDDLLDVARITRGHIELRMAPLDLREVLTEALNNVSSHADSRGQHISPSLPEEAVWVQGDATRLVQVVCNLLTNAARYSPEGSPIDATLTREGSEAVVKVRDQGRGIAAGLLPHIFDLYTQGAREAPPGQGLGLGLTLVRHLVEMHGGQVQATSAGVGHGSEFTVRIPVWEPGGEPQPTATSQPAPMPAAPRQRVLVVEDNPDVAEALCELLGVLDQEARSAASARAALAEIEAFDPQVVLLDIGLPGTDGFQLARALREKLGKRTPILVALTGYGSKEDRSQAREAGFDHFLLKPASMDELRCVLAGLGPGAHG